MRALLRCVLAGCVVLAAWAAPSPWAQAANQDNQTDHVLGRLAFLKVSDV